jgi:SAM-dependent methyltransferase
MIPAPRGAIDFGRYTDDYAAHRPGLPAAFYDRLDALEPIRGSQALDLATGPGIVALELAARGSMVVGIDVSPEQIATAGRVARDRRLEDLAHFEVARAEDTGPSAESVDLVTAAQCWHWFDGDAALTEVRRVLRPGGVLAIVSYTYLVAHAPVARETEELILAFNPSWTMAGSTGLHPSRIDEVIRGGLGLVEAFCFDHDELFSHERWRGRMRTCNGVGSGELPPDEVVRFDAALAALLAAKYPDPMVVEHRVWCVVARKPAHVAG